MAEFDIEVLNSLDETINFGIRAGMENTLYEIGTIAVIRPPETNITSNQLEIKSIYQQGRIFFSIDNVLRIMTENTTMCDIRSFECNHIIESFCISPCEKFILICTQNGKITIRALSYSPCSDNEDKSFKEVFTIIFEEKLDPCYSTDSGFFVESFVKSFSIELEFYIVTFKGLVIKIVLEVDEDLDDLFKLEVVMDLNTDINICAFGYPYLCLEGHELIMLDVDSKYCQYDDSIGLKNIHAEGLHFLAYDITGNIYLIATLELLTICVNDKLGHLVNRFDNFIFLDDCKKNNKIHILGITKDQTEKKREIQLMPYPEPNVVYSIPVEGPVHLTSIKNLRQEVMFFTEIHKNNVLSEIRLQIVAEADPEVRVAKLIQKQRFDEAEVIAQTFDVSPEIVAKAKAQHIINKLICSSLDVDQLVIILDTISDHLFKLNCCDIVDCEFEIDTRRVLRYGAFMEVDVKDCSENKDNEIIKAKRRLNEKLYRFDTYISTYQNYSYRKWKDFVECDLIKEMKILLEKGDTEGATVIYSRLDSTALSLLTYEKIKEIIYVLNKDVVNRPFLNTFISISLKYVPESLPIFVKWLHDRVYQLEKHCPVEFPECAIKFVKEYAELMNLAIPVEKYVNIKDSQIKLKNLLRALDDLKILLNHGLRLPLAEYLTGPSNTIKTLCSANLYNVNIEALMTDFVCPFVLKHNLNMDLIFVEEIRNLLEYEEEYWVNIVQVLLKFITNIDKKLELAYEILEVSRIPWSTSVKNIAQTTCQLAPSSPLAAKIAEHMNNEQILIILYKYGINKTYFGSLEDKIFCFKRMIYLNKPSVFEDIHNLCTDDEVRKEADLLIINKLLVRQDYEQAMSILDKNEPEKIVVLCKALLDRCLEYAISYNLPKKFRDPCYIALSLIWNRLKKYVKDKFDLSKLEFDYKVAYAIFELKDKFNVEIERKSELVRPKMKDYLLDHLIEQATELHLEEDASNFDTFLSNCKKVAELFEKDLLIVLMKCMKNNKNFNLFLRVGKYLLNTSECSKLLCCWALYLFKYLKNNAVDDIEETFLDSFLNVSKNEDYIEGIQLATKLCGKAMMFATSEDHAAVMEVIRWIDCCFYLANISKDSNIDTLRIYPTKKGLNRGINSIEAIKSIFNMYCATLESSHRPNTKYLTYFTTNVSTSQFHQEMEEEFTWNINIILEDDQYLTAYNVIKTTQQGLLCNSNFSVDTVLKFQSLIQTKWLPRTLEAILSYRYIDKTLLLNVLLLSENYEKQILHYLQVYRRHPNKLSTLTQVGLELFKYHRNTEGQRDLVNILNMCKWWHRIPDNIIRYNVFFTAKAEERLEALISAKQLNLDNLPEFCSDFGLDLQRSYLKYLEMTLKYWKPEIKSNNELELTKKCEDIIEYIKNKEDVFELIDQTWPSINFYYYEVFMVLLSLQTKLSSTNKPTFEEYRPLLSFLKSYKRVSTPSRTEAEQWFGSFPHKAFIDPLSEFRLPVTNTFFTSDIWTIIKPEVNLETYKEWFKLVPILKQYLNINDICTYAITTSVPCGLTHTSCTTWELYPKYEHLIIKAEECAKNITSLERVTATVYTLMCSMTPGIDKVRMAELSYKYAQVYRQSTSTDAVEKIYVKVKQRYFNYSAIHILHKYQLAEEEYLMLVGQPVVLISKLYQDPRIPKLICKLNFNCPDINKAVDELCALFDLNGKEKKFEVLSVLLKSNYTLDLDATHITNIIENQDEKSDGLMRAYYICGSADFRKPLLKVGINKDNIDAPMTFRANALKCLYYTCNPESIETMTGMNHEKFLDYMNKVSVIAKIGELGLIIKTVSQLDEFNKKKLLKELAKINKPLGIKCIASICKIYGLDDLKYWEFIVNTAIQYNMIKDLYQYMEYLRFRCKKDFITNAWNVIFNDAFTSQADINKDATTLRLLQTCPVIYELNYENLIEKCIFNKKLEIAAMLLQYLPQEKHEVYVQVILSKEGIIEDVNGLKNKGIVGISKVVNILEFHQYNFESTS